jgi:hypothetical protein
MSLTLNVAGRVREWVEAWPSSPDAGALQRVLRFLSQWRSLVLANTYLKHHGPRIHAGLFRGMAYVTKATEGALMPRLLGTYEAELHPHLSAFLAEGVDCIIDVGCAEGYYAVGLARLAPNVTVYAHDTDLAAQAACKALAARNEVGDRVVVGGVFEPGDFEAFAGRRVLVIVDAEGAEIDVLQPGLSRALADMAIIVETHDVYQPGALATMVSRFEATHDIVRVDEGPKAHDPPAWLKAMAELDKLIAVWEWRLQPTPWLIMRPKSRAQP